MYGNKFKLNAKGNIEHDVRPISPGERRNGNRWVRDVKSRPPGQSPPGRKTSRSKSPSIKEHAIARSRRCYCRTSVLRAYVGATGCEPMIAHGQRSSLVTITLYMRSFLRVANRPGMAGIVPELTHGVPCPGRGSFCPGNVKIDHRHGYMAVH